MAASLVIEFESGTIHGSVHRHDGYCSGFFGGHPVTEDEVSGRADEAMGGER